MSIHDLRQAVVAADALRRDWQNTRKFGAKAPRVAELIWVDPRSIDLCLVVLPKGMAPREASARVIDFAAEGVKHIPLSCTRQVQSSYQHWRDGVPWEETADFGYVMSRVKLLRAGASRMSKSMVRERYRALDDIYRRIAREGRFMTQKELKPWNFREYGGVRINVGAGGELTIMRASGMHRICIAKLVGLHCIPAQIGLVDVGALDYVEALRRRPTIGHAAPQLAAI